MKWLDGSMYMSLSKLGDGEGQGSLVCCSPWGGKESDMTQQLNSINNNSEEKLALDQNSEHLFYKGPESQYFSLCGPLQNESSHGQQLTNEHTCVPIKLYLPKQAKGFPGDPMAKTSTPSAGGPGSIPGQGIRPHMLQLRPSAPTKKGQTCPLDQSLPNCPLF